MFEITLYLFGKPQWELPTKKVHPALLRKKARELSKRLTRIASLTQKLRTAGWHVFLDTYSLVFYHDSITTEQELHACLRKHHITLKKTELYIWNEKDYAK